MVCIDIRPLCIELLLNDSAQALTRKNDLYWVTLHLIGARREFCASTLDGALEYCLLPVYMNTLLCV